MFWLKSFTRDADKYMLANINGRENILPDRIENGYIIPEEMW